MTERSSFTPSIRRTVRLDGHSSRADVVTSADAGGVLPTLPPEKFPGSKGPDVKDILERRTNVLPTPQCWKDFSDALSAGIDRIILIGPPGTGKTYAGLTMGHFGGAAQRLTCTEDMTAGDVTGHFMPSADGTWKWHEGAVVKAWDGDGSHGGRVVADEIDRASGDVFAILLNMFDNPESATWQHPESGVVLRPRPGFSVVMTSNIRHADDLPVALRDRFPVAIRIDQPHPAAVSRLSSDLQQAAFALAAADDDRRLSLRAFMAFEKLRDSLGAERAAAIVFGDRSTDVLDAMRVDAVA